MNERERKLAIITVSVVLIAVLKLWVVDPLWDRWSQSAQEERDLTAAIVRAEALAGRLDGLVVERAELREILAPAEDAGSGPGPRFIGRIQTHASRAGFEADAVREVRREEVGAFRQYVFWLRATADIDAIVRFLAELEGSDAYIRVSALTLSPGSSGGRRTSDLNADMTLVALTEGGAAQGRNDQGSATR